MSIADARYEPSETEVLLVAAIGAAEERVKKLRQALMAIVMDCDNRQNLSAEEVIGGIAERANEALNL